MRHSYGIVDRRNILLYKPQLFQKHDDLLIFPSRDLQKWHSEIIELLDGIYQIDSRNRDPAKYVGIEDLNLTIGLLLNINEQLENIFNPAQELDQSYHYISMVDAVDPFHDQWPVTHQLPMIIRVQAEICHDDMVYTVTDMVVVSPEFFSFVYYDFFVILEYLWIVGSCFGAVWYS